MIFYIHFAHSRQIVKTKGTMLVPFIYNKIN